MKIIVFVSAALLLGCGPAPQDSRTAADGDYSERMAKEHEHDQPTANPMAQSATSDRVRSQTVTYGRVGGRDVEGYLAYPADAEGGLPAVLVLHEWWGLNDNIRAMTNQLAAEGYAALALDLYGGQFADQPEKARALMEASMAKPKELSQNILQAYTFLNQEIKAARIGAIGWCFGGGMSLKAGLELGDRLDAVIVYYGHVGGDPEELKRLKAPLLGLFGAADQGIPLESVKAFESALKSLGKPAEIHVYAGAAHAFANPSGGNYKADAAQDAWKRSVDFLATHLKAE